MKRAFINAKGSWIDERTNYLCRFAKQIIYLNLKVLLKNLQRPSTNGNINIL